jgi:hypothetical protein
MLVTLLLTLQAAAGPIDIGDRLELLVDQHLIAETTGGAELHLHRPTPREIVLKHHESWEGSGSGYHTVFRDGDLYRMYYKAWNLGYTEDGKLDVNHPTFGAYAESPDGIHWTKPELGLHEYERAKDNNIIWTGKGSHDFTPFRDPNPACPPGETYKAVGQGSDPTGLYAMMSADGIRWDMMQDAPILTACPFDTQNVAFWDTVRGEYRVYFRCFRDGVRIIKTATSKDFRTWSDHVELSYPGAAINTPLYTNQVKPYYRAPHLFVGFPTRYIERPWQDATMLPLPNPEHRRMRSDNSERHGAALTDTLFMTSRDGHTFNLRDEAFLRPGRRNNDNWAYGDNYMAWQMVETESTVPGGFNELSMYATESYWTAPGSALRRFTIRIDGFVSMNAPLSGGGFTTKPLVFDGDRLALNLATSAAGSVRVEIQDAEGKAIAGYALADCDEVFGDDLARTVTWNGTGDVSALAGAAVRLRFELRDADLYAFGFGE